MNSAQPKSQVKTNRRVDAPHRVQKWKKWQQKIGQTNQAIPGNRQKKNPVRWKEPGKNVYEIDFRDKKGMAMGRKMTR